VTQTLAKPARAAAAAAVRAPTRAGSARLKLELRRAAAGAEQQPTALWMAVLSILIDSKSVNVYEISQRRLPMRSVPPLPLPVKRALAKLGADIRSARLRRRISTTIMAGRAFITRTTLLKVEHGDPGVSLGIYATVLFVLGLTPRLADLADARADETGLQLEEERLPKRIRQSGGRTEQRPK
jgi:transcriptional regulator with XRE-family HTH domain